MSPTSVPITILGGRHLRVVGTAGERALINKNDGWENWDTVLEICRYPGGQTFTEITIKGCVLIQFENSQNYLLLVRKNIHCKLELILVNVAEFCNANAEFDEISPYSPERGKLNKEFRSEY